MFQKNGGELLDNHMVTDIIPGPVVTVVTTRATFNTKKLVITAGAWAPSLTKKLGLQLPFKVIAFLVILEALYIYSSLRYCSLPSNTSCTEVPQCLGHLSEWVVVSVLRMNSWSLQCEPT